MFLEKLKSRKFLAALVGVISGLAMIFGLDAEVISTVTGAVVAMGALVTYIVTEGSIDRAALVEAIDKTETAIKLLGDEAHDSQ